MLNKVSSPHTPAPVTEVAQTPATNTAQEVKQPKLSEPPLMASGGPSGATKSAGQAAGPSALVATMAMAQAAPAKEPSLVDVQKAKDTSVTRVFAEPTRRTATTVTFAMPDYSGTEIKPGERWLFEIPPDLRGTPIRTAILAHRKDQKYSDTVKDKWDSEGAYNLVTARKSGTDNWVTWRDEYGSKKFAEPRSAGDPENENLHDWLDCVGPTAIDMLSVTNVGKGDKAIANVHFVEIEFFPPGKKAGEIEEIFSPGTAFASPDKGVRKPKYGGGMGAHLSEAQLKEHGLYPNSVELGGYGGSKQISEHARVDEQGRLRIKLPPGKVFGSLEVSVGDTRFDKNRPVSEQKNKDGHVGELGYAKLYAHVENPDGKRSKSFMEKVNVPPSGVLSGGPVDPGYIARPGDEIVISSQSHKSWVMGYRVTFMEAPEAPKPQETPVTAPKAKPAAKPEIKAAVQAPVAQAATATAKPATPKPAAEPIQAKAKPSSQVQSAPVSSPTKAVAQEAAVVSSPTQSTAQEGSEAAQSTPTRESSGQWWNPASLFRKLVGAFKRGSAAEVRSQLDGAIGPLASGMADASQARKGLAQSGNKAELTAASTQLAAQADQLQTLSQISDKAVSE